MGIMDALVTFCRGIKGTMNLPATATAVGTTAAIVGDVIDTGNQTNYFSGVPQFIRVLIQTLLASTGTAPILALCGSNDWNGSTGTWTPIVTVASQATVAAWNTAYPVGTPVQALLPNVVPYRYLSLQWGITTNPATAGTITADITSVKE